MGMQIARMIATGHNATGMTTNRQHMIHVWRLKPLVATKTVLSLNGESGSASSESGFCEITNDMWSDDDNAQLPYTNAGYRCIGATLFISRPEYGYRHRQSLRFNTVEVAMHECEQFLYEYEIAYQYWN